MCRLLALLALLVVLAAPPAQAEQPPIIWFQPGANAQWLRTPEGVARMMAKCRRAGIKIVVFDIEQRGYFTYPSRYGPHISEIKQWGYPPGYDLIKLGLREAHRRGLKLYINRAYGNPELHPEWRFEHYQLCDFAYAPDGWPLLITRSNGRRGINELVIYHPNFGKTTGTDDNGTEVVVVGDRVQEVRVQGNSPIPPDGFVLSGSGYVGRMLTEHYQAGGQVRIVSSPWIVRSDLVAGEDDMCNPFLPANKERCFRVMREALKRYPVDGIMMDFVRYLGYDTDFGDFSRASFEDFLGKRAEHWPEDILTWQRVERKQVMRPGPLFREWSMWRAMAVKQYFEDHRRLVHSLRPGLPYADYVGAWYPTYNEVGVNWASDRYYPRYDWVLPGYSMTGYAGDLSFLCVGLYYKHVTIAEAAADGSGPVWSIEGGADLAREVVKGATPVIGTLYVLLHKGNPEQFRQAVLMARRKTDGAGIFDASYIESYGWWELLREALREPLSVERGATRP